MVKHIILWKLKEEYSAEQKAEIKNGIKDGLEGLLGVIDGLTEIKVYNKGLDSSTADLMLYSVFESENSLKSYSRNPAHQDVANKKVRPFVKTRLCLDFEE